MLLQKGHSNLIQGYLFEFSKKILFFFGYISQNVFKIKKDLVKVQDFPHTHGFSFFYNYFYYLLQKKENYKQLKYNGGYFCLAHSFLFLSDSMNKYV